MNLFGKNKNQDKGDNTSSPVVSDKTKSSVGLVKKSALKIVDVLHKKFGSTKKVTDSGESMTNSEYLGEIFNLLVQNKEEQKRSRHIIKESRL